MTVKELGKYTNGNYTVTVYSDGTKIRENNLDNLIPSFAESCDLKITDKCDGGCEFCYEGCTLKGNHSDLLSYHFLDTLHPYTELTINGNDLTHPQLAKFLMKMKKQKVFVNITVNQKHFSKNYNTLKRLSERGLIYGIGVSLTCPTQELIEKLASIPNTVLHVIAGVFQSIDLTKLEGHGIKLLILGYKKKGRGIEYYNSYSYHVDSLIHWLKGLIHNKKIFESFSVVSFDDLALEQLQIKKLFEKQEDWNKFYIRNGTDYTFYIDAVNGTFSKNSITSDQYLIKEEYSIDDMFKLVRNK